MPTEADDRTPVLVGVGVATQRMDDAAQALEPLDLMLEAVRRAGADAGGAHALAAVQRIAVPKGRWRYRNPGRAIAQAIGAPGAVSVLSTWGVLQQSLINDACARIAAGTLDTALVVGGEASYRMLRAKLQGQRAEERQQADAPDEVQQAEDDLLHPVEMAAGIRLPAALYAILGSAWRAKQGLPADQHRQSVAELYAGFSRVAQSNPAAWTRQAYDASQVLQASERNPMQGFPYTKLHCSALNVDQAAALLLCSVRRAVELGIPRERFVYAWAGSESNHVVPVSARGAIADCAGARLAGQAVLKGCGLQASQVELVDLYSCFPIAVEMIAHALGLPLDPQHPPTLTGGMSFAGGPFNNYVLQSTCRMVERMRAGEGSLGLISCVSGVLNKVGFGLWGRTPGPVPFQAVDVSNEAAAQTVAVPVIESLTGPGRIVGHTVVHERGSAPRALVLADAEAGARTLAWSDDPAIVERFTHEELCGAAVTLQGSRLALA